jgi:hypothetical protein
MVRSNNGAPGIDKTTLAQVEEYGVTRLLDELASGPEGERYRPVRRHPRPPETPGNFPVAGTRLDQLSRSEPHPLTPGPVLLRSAHHPRDTSRFRLNARCANRHQFVTSAIKDLLVAAER